MRGLRRLFVFSIFSLFVLLLTGASNAQRLPWSMTGRVQCECVTQMGNCTVTMMTMPGNGRCSCNINGGEVFGNVARECPVSPYYGQATVAPPGIIPGSTYCGHGNWCRPGARCGPDRCYPIQ
jgi:hypothetical protein